MALSESAIQARLVTAGLPSFARTIGKLEHLITEAEAPAQVVAAVIATDPAITALILGQANAAGHTTTQLTEAIRRIGLGAVLNTARSTNPVPDNQRQALASMWAQANAVAVAVPILAEHRRNLLRGRWDDETLRVVGLVHDLGHVLALGQFSREYERASGRLKQGEAGFDALLAQEIGAGPSDLARLASGNWSLPPILSTPMIHWRHPAEGGEHTELAALVHISHILVHAAGFVAAGDLYLEPLSEWALSLLDLRTSDLETVLSLLYDQMDELELYEGALGG
jgi:HD-like signal output (HDOD) protein